MCATTSHPTFYLSAITVLFLVLSLLISNFVVFSFVISFVISFSPGCMRMTREMRLRLSLVRCAVPCVVRSPDFVDLDRFEERQVLRCLAASTLNYVEYFEPWILFFWTTWEDFRCRNCRPSPNCRGLRLFAILAPSASFHDFREPGDQLDQVPIISCHDFNSLMIDSDRSYRSWTSDERSTV